MAARGQNSGQPTWAVYLDGLVAEHGSLAAVSERLAALHGWRDDVDSITRALRRLRTRGSLPGGKWGDRLLRTFGLPASVDARLRFMGSYHSRFVDLPVPLCTDLVQLWDRPPTSESRPGRLWLSLARATLALRARQPDEAATHLATARTLAPGDPAAQIELALGESLLDSPARPTAVSAALAEVPELLQALGGPDADCLRARYVGQVSHALNHAGAIDQAEALHAALPDTPGTHPFARSRRANGLAYGRFRHGDLAAALDHARLAARHAGDAGHVRLRAMALLMVVRVTTPGSPEAQDALARARTIAHALEDATLLARCDAARRGRHGAP
ncbi:hypothetical protein [Nannocystis pusilla]|uniref:Uncharacterized protein n=1 Tax=Nannocystis pusilla TaxID=889268 RepID=A0ABS7TKK7_9BACT|nr:hypothetical protein [Nannocystis pusilla]MBZ5708762.1 hypothetical protein [Nannocystis pusilla]